MAWFSVLEGLLKNARRGVRPVTLQQLRRRAQSDAKAFLAGDEAAFVETAAWTKQELITRLSTMLVDFYRMPYMQTLCRHMVSVHNTHLRTVDTLKQFQRLRTQSDVVRLTRTLKIEQRKSRDFVALVRLGILEKRGADLLPSDHYDVESFVRDMLAARIGTRLLCDNLVAWVEQAERFKSDPDRFTTPAHLGAVASGNVGGYLRESADSVVEVARCVYGRSPAVVFDEVHARDAVFVPQQIQFMFQELLKNAAKATLEHHAEEAELPPVRVALRAGTSELELELSDRGGGMTEETMERSFRFSSSLWRTAPGSVSAAGLSGFGVGLPLTRAIAQSFGGDVRMQSLAGFGSNLTVRIPLHGDRPERLTTSMAKALRHADQGDDPDT